jgi:hypothetical protein
VRQNQLNLLIFKNILLGFQAKPTQLARRLAKAANASCKKQSRNIKN